MSQSSAIQTAPDPAPIPVLDPAASFNVRDEPEARWDKARRILGPLASLKLTVILFSLSIFLVFCGTLAQVEMGIGTAVESYFRSAFVMIPFQIFVRFGQVFLGISKDAYVPGSFPYPGGWLLGGLLLANLLAAHLVRFRMSWKRAGILLIHSGLIIMMLGELITGLFAVESRMTIAIGETANYLDVVGETELAFTDSSNPKLDDVVVIPGSLLRKGGVIQHAYLPADIEIVRYMKNSVLIDAKEALNKDEYPDIPNEEREKPTFKSAVSQAESIVVSRSEVSGVSTDGGADYPAVRVRFLKKGTKEVIGEEYVFSLWFNPNMTNRLPIYRFPLQFLRTDGKSYKVELRPKRLDKKYSIHLLEFTHDVYPGTDKPKNFASRIVLHDTKLGEKREVTISMNDPMRYRGETFYQSGYLPGSKGTVLQVVRNPGWLMPYLSCAVVSIGMIVHFGLHLITFLRRRAA